MKANIKVLGALALFAVLMDCGGGGSSPPPVAVSVAPTAAALKPGDRQGFNATVTGSSNTAVTWTVQEGAAGGTIDNTGVYTAPINDGTFHVIATSQANAAMSATATVTVTGTFAVNPASTVLGPLGVSAFSAGVGVTWSVQEGTAGGVITVDGYYTAPNTTGVFHVVATSVDDSSKTVIANVTVTSAGFMPTGAMSTGRTGHTGTLLQDGRVLVTGGDSCYFFRYYGNCPLDSAEIYDPGTGAFTSTGKMAVKRVFHTATLLGNGKILVAGGSSASAELYDPAAGTFAATGSMSVARNFQTATLLTNGKVLVVGGYNVSGTLNSAELYDPVSGTFTATGATSSPRASHTATLLADGKVLIAGGFNVTGVLNTAELYDPATGSFTATSSSMTSKRRDHAATLLGNSTVLLTGGNDNNDALSSAELYDSVAGNFVAASPMLTTREFHAAILLNNGSVLIAGGNDSTAELYDVASGSFTQTGGLDGSRAYPAAVLLKDGRVFMCGGSDSSSAELYK